MHRVTILAFWGIVIVLAGCSGDDNPAAPIPDPVADFQMTGSTITPTTITFTNLSANANSYYWDFGDGRSSIQESPQVTFTTYGTFTITLAATQTATSKSDTARNQLRITPGKAFLDSVIVEQFPFVNDQGVGWDATSGPDFQWDLTDSADVTQIFSNTRSDVSPSDLPLRYYASPAFEFRYWDGPYWIIMWDEDVTDWEFIGLVGIWVENLIRANGYASSHTVRNAAQTIRVRLVMHWQ